MLDHKDKLFTSPGARAMSGFKSKVQKSPDRDWPLSLPDITGEQLAVCSCAYSVLAINDTFLMILTLFFSDPQDTKSLRLKENEQNMKGRKANKYEVSAKFASVGYIID